MDAQQALEVILCETEKLRKNISKSPFPVPGWVLSHVSAIESAAKIEDQYQGREILLLSPKSERAEGNNRLWQHNTGPVDTRGVKYDKWRLHEMPGDQVMTGFGQHISSTIKQED